MEKMLEGSRGGTKKEMHRRKERDKRQRKIKQAATEREGSGIKSYRKRNETMM